MTGRLVYVLFGDTSVGKSHLIQQYVTHGIVPGDGYSTLGVDCAIHRERVQNRELIVQLWDISGHKRYHSIAYYYLQIASVVLLVYDIGDRDSYVSIQQQWGPNARARTTNQHMTFVLVGNKSDTTHREVTYHDGLEYATQEGFMFFEVSAMTGESVDRLFQETTRNVMTVPSAVYVEQTVDNQSTVKSGRLCERLDCVIG
jgi:Ras-related protein Rab-2A